MDYKMDKNFIIYIIIGIMLGVFISFIFPSFLNEGMVMNKWISEGYDVCIVQDKCIQSETKYIIAIQDGDKKDWWLVSKNYFDTINIGNWVKKYDNNLQDVTK